MKIKAIALSMLSRVLQSRGYHLHRTRAGSYKSETAKCRERLAKYCIGYGLDLGFGGDPITESAIRVDLPIPYADTGLYSVQLGGDATKLDWFAEGTLDFIYSSHLLEDFEDTEAVLREWWRVLKTGGILVIFCPDEQVYRNHCASTGQSYNVMHKHSNFSLATVKNVLAGIAEFKVVHECPLVDIYSWELVCKKL